MRTHRLKLGLTLDTLAKMLGVSKNTPLEWEYGRCLAGNLFQTKKNELCEILGVPLEELSFSVVQEASAKFYVFGLIEALKARGIIVRQLAKTINIPECTIRKIARKKQKASFERIEKISKAIGVPVVPFCGGYKFNISKEGKNICDSIAKK